MANSTTIITDLNTVITNGPSTTTTANAINPSGVTSTGGAGNFNAGSGVYASGTYYGGILDYVGSVKLVLLKAQEIAVLLARIVADTDQASDSANSALLQKILNDFQ